MGDLSSTFSSRTDMKTDRTALERAFELARSGKFANVTEVKLTVAREGYAMGQMEGPMLARQLKALIKAHRLPASTV